MKNTIAQLLRENKSLLLFIILMCVFRSAVADWNTVPTGSMQPTILEGDRILINKLAYDVQFPFTNYSLIKLSDPARGDIIVFESEVSEARLVKRVVGIPGDIVKMQDNILYINNQKLQYEDSSTGPVFLASLDKIEDLLGIKHSIRIDIVNSEKSNFPAVKVPQGYYLALGDNRDKSRDSRVIGFIPRNEIIGRSSHVLMSLNYEKYYLPRSNRFFHAL